MYISQIAQNLAGSQGQVHSKDDLRTINFRIETDFVVMCQYK